MSRSEAETEVLVCTKCRMGADVPDNEPRAGARLYAQLTAGPIPKGVSVKPVECLSNCTQGCSIALRGPGRWTYVYGRLDAAEHVQTVLEGASLYQQSADGLVPWRERPEHFRKNCIARIPPLELASTEA